MMGRRVSQSASKGVSAEPWYGQTIRCEDCVGGSWGGEWLLPGQEKGSL